uniref:Iron-sulfur cluster formation ABC transporterATP-binding subunit n=1 Tax=Polysiphonia sertularioides TaxID=945028 RepID=A0A1Z1M9M3_9FLOR|nr:Iron-sulfur cluster formation ABC transporterATP-binding subunit [Polysiphonia sertularioides]ARW62475.1 Iron-sulfur cluster formation ABC transporterATP-binding subunit [Polysiphonia sertularioides]
MCKSEEILRIDNLHVSIKNECILKGLNLSINKGEIHVIMGKNGSGKSTLAKVISGHPLYNVTHGKILLKNEDITHADPDYRAHQGIFLGFQYPVEVPGVSNIDFLRMAYNSRKKILNEDEIDPLSFFELVNQKIKNINMSPLFLERSLNEGFSGGEKKKNEILQMSLLDTELSVLDEIDSGLDVDALRDIADSIKNFHKSHNSLIMITHYQKLIEYINPDYVHIMDNGSIKLSGNKSLAIQIDQYGYENLM